MQTPETPRAPSIRARGQLRVLAAIALGVLFTLSSAAAQLLPGRRPPPPPDPVADEVAALAGARRERIAALEAAAPGARCRPPEARELARLYAMDGRTDDARAFGDAYEQRCGEDPEVARWAAAPAAPPRRAVEAAGRLLGYFVPAPDSSHSPPAGGARDDR